MNSRPVPQRMLMPLLERLLDETPEHRRSHEDALDLVRGAVCRDIEAMLNACRP